MELVGDESLIRHLTKLINESRLDLHGRVKGERNPRIRREVGSLTQAG